MVYAADHKMDTVKRKRKKLIRIDWDDVSKGCWHYVPAANIKVLPGSELKAGGQVRCRYGGVYWTGTIAPKKKRQQLVFGECAVPNFKVKCLSDNG